MPPVLLFVLTLSVTFVLTVIALRFLIPRLKSHKMGQKILDIGPRWHKSKEGTPTMGGLSFLFASLVTVAALTLYFVLSGQTRGLGVLLLTYGMAFGNGLIGVLDDYLKVFKKQNEGLKAWQKYLLQLIVCGLYLFLLTQIGCLPLSFPLPFTDHIWEPGLLLYPLYLILLTGMINSVNLADGIDGLAATESAIVGGFFGFLAFLLGKDTAAPLAAVMMGGSLGFLTYNFHPARIFMGDTGSLFLGGLTAGLAFMMDLPLLSLIAGFMFAVESISVILQVASFKLTGKRIFKMSPIHHHFEKCGWSEIKIVIVFSLLTLGFCILAGFSIR